ncbi:unnamed protein product [Phytophthora lilii]|uniref:Unnamed protein product n=1 Tax=Phytophthora lilii TaxID=2077276 RepID=A0A9W6U161_9STRA|nr:unnamed protein product [Phytophthora lilii]
MKSWNRMTNRASYDLTLTFMTKFWSRDLASRVDVASTECAFDSARKPLESDNFQQSFDHALVPSFATIPFTSCETLTDEGENEDFKDSSSDFAKSPAKKTRCVNDTPDCRRQQYRQRMKNEREELRKMERDLSKKVQEIVAARRGSKTTARTDLLLAKSFWKGVALRQRELRACAEAERRRLSAVVNSQATYIENIGVALRERPNWPSPVVAVGGAGGRYDRTDDRKWLRLKSSDAALYEEYLQDVFDNYARIDRVFNECDINSLGIGSISALHQHNANGEIEYVQNMSKSIQPFSFEDTCIKFRVQKTLATGSNVSILKRIVLRRFVKASQAVLVWKIFSEGEGIFSGMDVDETVWMSIQPHYDGQKFGTLKKVCSRQVPVQYIATNANNSNVKAFQAMLQESLSEDVCESHAVKLVAREC